MNYMKTMHLLTLVASFSGVAIGQCDTTITGKSTIREIRAKMACLEAENQKVRQPIVKTCSAWGMDAWRVSQYLDWKTRMENAARGATVVFAAISVNLGETDVHLWYCKDQEKGRVWKVEQKTQGDFKEFPFDRLGTVPIGFFKGLIPGDYDIYFLWPKSQ